MHTLNHTLEQSLIEADGRYLSSTELYPLEQYIRSYTTRLQTYQQLSKHSEKLVMQTLRKFAQTYPEPIRQHGARCKYDMTEMVRYIALSILRNDELFFKEQMMSWFDTIMRAYKKTNHCTTAYRYLQKAVDATLPPACSSLVRSYIDIVTLSLESHA